MELNLNGKTEQIQDVQTVADLIGHFDLAVTQVAVELNEELVPRAKFAESILNEGDTVEIVTFVGGG